MERQNIIIIHKENNYQAWGALKEACKENGFPYHSLKSKNFPFDFEGWNFVKVPFRKMNRGLKDFVIRK